MRPGPLIAIYVLSLYLFLAPVLLFGIFVFFDRLGRPRADAVGKRASKQQRPGQSLSPEDPAVWTVRDISRFRDQA
jgi:hypothetical protein